MDNPSSKTRAGYHCSLLTRRFQHRRLQQVSRVPSNNRALSMASPANPSGQLRRELGLRDLVLAQVLDVVGSGWVGVASKLGQAHAVFWMSAMLLYYVPLALVV